MSPTHKFSGPNTPGRRACSLSRATASMRKRPRANRFSGAAASVHPHGCSTLMGRVSESGLQHRRIEVKRLLRKRIPESAYV